MSRLHAAPASGRASTVVIRVTIRHSAIICTTLMLCAIPSI
jgi:hypothetical protein